MKQIPKAKPKHQVPKQQSGTEYTLYFSYLYRMYSVVIKQKKNYQIVKIKIKGPKKTSFHFDQKKKKKKKGSSKNYPKCVIHIH